MALAKEATDYFIGNLCRIEIPHEHRWWEYGSAVQLCLERKPKTVLCVGSGADALGPTLAYNFDVEVTECEPDEEERRSRVQVNKVLQGKYIKVLANDIHSLPDEQYDIVYCISVLEHVKNERQAWQDLASRVKPKGLLFITADCVPDPNKKYVMDNLRVTNYTLGILQERIESLKGFTPISTPNYEWHGALVFDYTFFRVAMERKEA